VTAAELESGAAELVVERQALREQGADARTLEENRRALSAQTRTWSEQLAREHRTPRGG
jgi:hypothetical protein